MVIRPFAWPTCGVPTAWRCSGCHLLRGPLGGPHSLTRDDSLDVPGGSHLVLRNQTDGPILAAIEDLAWTGEATTAAQVTTLPEFRELFSSEVLAPRQQLAVSHIAFLFSDLKGSTQLFEGIGDAAAYSRVNRHFDFIRQAVGRGGGSVIKTMGDGVMSAFYRLDDALSTEAVLSLAAEPPPPGFDQAAFSGELAGLMATYRHLSLKELRLGPLLQQLTEISVRHQVRLPSSLALIGKAFGQMQLAAAELDPSLDPFSVAGSFYLRQLAGRLRTAAGPGQLFYESQKLRVRAVRLLEGHERTLGVRGGTGLQVDFRGAQDLTTAIRLAGRRIAIGLAATTAIVGTAVTASGARSAAWVAAVFGIAAALLTGGLLIDVLRHR